MLARRERFVTTKQFLETSRSYDISTEECILEALDNSFDASADKISIEVDKYGDNQIRISITDNGVGIPSLHVDDDGIEHQGIPYVLAYGGRIPHPGKISIGKFGWGLSQAASSISSRTEIFSKTIDDDKWRFAYYDFEELEKSDYCELEPEIISNPPHFKLSETGTIVIFYMDRSEYKTVNGVVNMVKKNLSRIYRKILQNGAKIEILYMSGGKKRIDNIEISDPTHQIPGSQEVSRFGLSNGPYNHSIILDGSNSLGVFIDPKTSNFAEIIVKVCLLDINKIQDELGVKAGPQLSKWNISVDKQGFSIMRNGREIREAETLSIWTKNGSHQYIRGEIEFPEILDDLFNVQVNKSRFNINSSLRMVIENTCNKTIRSLVKESNENISRRRIQRKKKEIPTAEIITAVIKNSLPPIQISEEEKLDGKKKKEIKIKSLISRAEIEGEQNILSAKEKLILAENEDDKERINTAKENLEFAIADKKSSIQKIRNRFKFNTPIRKQLAVLSSGDMYSIEHLGEEVWITMNTDTPFFRSVYEKSLMKPEQESLLDLLIFAMAWAEHMKRNEPSIKAFWEEARPAVSQNAHLFCSYMKLDDSYE